jgi:hypothetical protein
MNNTREEKFLPVCFSSPPKGKNYGRKILVGKKMVIFRHACLPIVYNYVCI